MNQLDFWRSCFILHNIKAVNVALRVGPFPLELIKGMIKKVCILDR